MNILTSDADRASGGVGVIGGVDVILVKDGTAVVRKLGGERKVLLNLEQSETERVSNEVGGLEWTNVLRGRLYEIISLHFGFSFHPPCRFSGGTRSNSHAYIHPSFSAPRPLKHIEHHDIYLRE